VRTLIDQLLVRGETYKRILQAIEPLQGKVEDGRVSYHSIRRHQLRHLPVDELAIRAILERRARDAGLQVAIGDSPIITNAATLEVIRNAGFDGIVRGGLSPTVRETIQAAVALEQFDRSGDNSIDLAEFQRQVRLLLEVVQARLPEAEWQSLVAEFEARLDPRPELPPTNEEAQP